MELQTSVREPPLSHLQEVLTSRQDVSRYAALVWGAAAAVCQSEEPSLAVLSAQSSLWMVPETSVKITQTSFGMTPTTSWALHLHHRGAKSALKWTPRTLPLSSPIKGPLRQLSTLVV